MRKKSQVISGWMAILSLAFLGVQCSEKKEFQAEENPLVENPIPLPNLRADFEPVVEAGTKSVTTADGKVSWDAADALKAYIVPSDVSGTISWQGYMNKYATDAQKCTKGIFTPQFPNELEATKTYNWYVMSPYSDKVKDPVGGTSSKTEFSFDGQTIDLSQPLSHLTAYDVVTGVAKNIPADQTPALQLKHKGTLMKFTLKNTDTQDMTLQKVDFIAPEGANIGGTYSIDFAPEGVLTPKSAANQLTVTIGGTDKVLKVGASAELYVVMPPFALKANDSFTLKVQTNIGLIERTTTPTIAKTFLAGTLNRATIPLSFIHVSEVTLDKEVVNMQKGETATLTATVLPKIAHNQKVSWTSNHPEIVKVDEKGKLTALAIGDATITVTSEDGNKTATCTVHVMGFKSGVAMKVNTSQTLELQNLPSDAGTVNWESNNPDVVSVTASGTLRAFSTGGAEITATVASLGMTFKCNVRVIRENEFAIMAGNAPIVMIKVQAGTFTMGAQSTDPNGANYDVDAENRESPVHQVTLTHDYYIGQTEVTQELWEAVMGSNPSNHKGNSQYPVEKVSWDDICGAGGFLEKLNALTGKTFALPTEAQWEYAARGGHKMSTPNKKYSGSDNIDEVAWYGENSGGETHPVGEKLPNELGLYDMSGNVYEWCADWEGNYSSEAQTDPLGPSSGSFRVLRGGSFWRDARYCRVSNRYDCYPDYRYNSYGLRLVLVP